MELKYPSAELFWQRILASEIYDCLIQLFRNDSENEIEVEKEILGSYGIQNGDPYIWFLIFQMGLWWWLCGGDTSLPHAFLCHITKSFPFFPNKAWKIKKIYNRCPPTFTLVLYLSLTRTIHTDCAWHLTILTLYQL